VKAARYCMKIIYVALSRRIRLRKSILRPWLGLVWPCDTKPCKHRCLFVSSKPSLRQISQLITIYYNETINVVRQKRPHARMHVVSEYIR